MAQKQDAQQKYVGIWPVMRSGKLIMTHWHV